MGFTKRPIRTTHSPLPVNTHVLLYSDLTTDDAIVVSTRLHLCALIFIYNAMLYWRTIMPLLTRTLFRATCTK